MPSTPSSLVQAEEYEQAIELLGQSLQLRTEAHGGEGAHVVGLATMCSVA